MSEGPLGLTDEEFWVDAMRTKSEVSYKLMDEEFEGTVIDAPNEVPLDLRETLPVVAVQVGRQLKIARDFPFRESAFLTAVNLRTGAFYLGRTTSRDFRRRGRQPNATASPTAWVSDAFRIAGREQLRIPWEADEYVLTLFNQDQVSNRRRVKLLAAGYKDPEVERVIDEKRRQATPTGVWPVPAEAGLPTFARTNTSPEIPVEAGITLAVERVTVMKDGSQFPLHGSFRLPVGVAQIVKPDRLADQDTSFPAGPMPTAVVPISIVATGSDQPNPTVGRLLVPSWDPIAAGAEEATVTGHFALDLGSLANLPPQTYFIYAFAGEVMTGPATMALVAEDALK